MSTNYTVVGIFNHLNADGQLNNANIQYLQAFVKGISDVSDQHNIHIDYLVRSTYSVSNAARLSLALLDSYSNLLAVVTTITNNDMLTVIENVFNENEVIVISARSDSASFVYGSSYPYSIQMVPPSSFEGRMMRYFLCNANVGRFVTISSDGEYGQQVHMFSCYQRV